MYYLWAPAGGEVSIGPVSFVRLSLTWYTIIVPLCPLVADAAVTVDELGPYVDVMVVVNAEGLIISTVPAVPLTPTA